MHNDVCHIIKSRRFQPSALTRTQYINSEIPCQINAIQGCIIWIVFKGAYHQFTYFIRVCKCYT